MRNLTGPKLASWVNKRATEEAMAGIAQRGEKITGVKKLVYLIQKLLRFIGLDRLANKLEAKTDSEALMALHKAEMFAKSGINKDSIKFSDIYAAFVRNKAISNKAQTAFDTQRHEWDHSRTDGRFVSAPET